jgi:aminopeptidase N
MAGPTIGHRIFPETVLILIFVGLVACQSGQPNPEYGVSLELAQHRASRITELSYDLHFSIPQNRDGAVSGSVALSFTLSDAGDPVVLDFRGDSTSVARVTVNDTPVTPRLTPGHIVLAPEAFAVGNNIISLDFTAGDEALNRNDEFLYALFVPDRAATAFPSFDQPDLKARWRLTLDVPPGWRALANGAQLSRDTTDTGATISFAESEPLSTYLFTFAAGRFFVDEAVRDGRTLQMFHRETDTLKVARNRDAIFDLHATALGWLEEYTGIPYPFGKFAFFAVPSFQFGGMEHPGAVWYRASSLFLDPSATQNQYLGRASLIAHETAHMWFGDLVTMKWFSDVWMKEVFANFMAAKIVQPSFPDVNHDLRFLLAHHPTAYGVDRTLGANPIRQELSNLRQAGSLYGAIIYQKAPIVMRHLERLAGDTTFRNGLRIYLDRYQYGNATWPDLIAILDDLSDEDLAAWSRAWVEEPLRPQINARWSEGRLVLTQRDPSPDRGLHWTQQVGVALGYRDTIVTEHARLSDDEVTIELPRTDRPEWILPGPDGLSYGRFQLDSASRPTLLDRASSLPDPILRASAWMALWEELLAGQVAPLAFLDRTVAALDTETDELITQQLLGLIRTTYWRFLPDSGRKAVAPSLEAALWHGLDDVEGASRKGAYWGAIVNVTLTADGTARLERVWRKVETPTGLPLAEPQYTALAEALALREVENATEILDAEEARITNPDRLERFRFVRPALSGDPVVRDSVFAALGAVDNRHRESWALDALRYLGHPLRAQHAERYIEPGLGLLEEIQRTGDIFFPLNWLNALLDGHQSVAAAESVVEFLDANPALPPRLQGKLLQAADDLFRAARIVDGWTGGPVLESDSGSSR